MATSKRTVDAGVRRSKSNGGGALANLQCSYDLRGRLLEINEPLERVLGYSRQEVVGSNFREFMDPNSWELTRQTILEQTGGAAPQQQNIQVRRRTGELRTLEMATRLVFDKGMPVAVQATGRDLTAPSGQDLRETQALLSTKTTELNRFTGHLKELHRLSTTKYSSLAEVFADFLQAGCDIFRLNYGAVLRPEGDVALVQATAGHSSLLCEGARIPLARTPFSLLSDRVCSRIFDQARENGEVHADLQICIAAPIFVGAELYGTLSFSGKRDGDGHKFTGQDKELIELIARGLGRFILEDRMHAERKSAEDLVRTRNGILDGVAGNRPLAETLSELGRLLENQCPGLKCVFLLLEDGMLSSFAAPSLAAGLLSELRQHTLRFPAEPAEADFPFCEKAALAYSSSYPILSGAGTLLGRLVLFREISANHEPPDADVVMMSVRMAGIAIEQKYLADRLTHQAQHDSLTGLPNRFRLVEILDSHVETAKARLLTVAVLFIDLDRFKQINETLGHAAGDQLLVEVARRLRGCLNDCDFAGRMGGDEFAVVLANPDSEAAAIETSGKVLDTLRSPYLIDGRELFVTASIGISFFPKHGEDSSTLLRAADSAMYNAKNDGKNALECFVPNGHHGGMERLELENGLRRALEKSEFELNFQPIVSMGGRLHGFEVLLGWSRANLGRISPARFIPIAEDTGLIVPIGQWVLQQACLQGAAWLDAGLPLESISVNVSALQFARPNFVETVAAVLDSTGFPAKLLELELTESLVLRDTAESIERMTQLQRIGVTMTIDDFGTGYSSLNYLRRLPVAGLKIDQSFLRDLQSPSSTLTVVETIVSLAHNMNLTVVAEGVETLHELELMRIAGCDRVQGHLYGMPLKAASAEQLLSTPDCSVPVLPELTIQAKSF